MNIQQAKEEIARTYRAYLKRNEDGSYRIPPEKQRPVLLIGPPGIGKTAIMKQIAQEQGCGLVAYSMTHHTRQSAIGLPFISHKEYGGEKRAVTEYTMSEIVASVYEYMEKTGKRSGILFLDEINCVSETLSPVILQLLQNKTFGNVALPKDWIIVTAGNPPEYNSSVREFDMVTLDRVKRIDVEADLPVWQSYAIQHGIHPAIRAYLSIYPDHFYNITDRNGEQFFVTARGWEDLSLMLGSYEEDGIEVDGDWFLQYLQHDEIARSFAFFYRLFRTFDPGSLAAGDGADISEILLEQPSLTEELSSTECLSLASMLFHPLQHEAVSTARAEAVLEKKKALLARMPSDEAFADDESIRAFFSQKRKEAERKLDQTLTDPEGALLEKEALCELESDVYEWYGKSHGERGSVSAYEKEIQGAEEERIRDNSLKIGAAADRAIRVIRNCPQGRSALFYFLSDMSSSKEISGLLKSHNVELRESD